MTCYYSMDNTNNNTGDAADETDSCSTTTTTTCSYIMSLDTLRAMRQQETQGYQVPTAHLKQRVDQFPDDIPLYLEWRRAMIEWNYNIASTCKFRSDTVEIATSMVDRFVAVQTELLGEAHQYQVACMAGLYIAAKIHEEQCLTPQQMETLSCGRFRAEDITDMEQQILRAVEWRVNPPTAGAFCRKLIDLVPVQLLSPDAQVLALDVAESHIQLALPEPSFLGVNTSALAVASLMNALRCVLGHDSNLTPFYDGFSDALWMRENNINNNESSSLSRMFMYEKLRTMVVQSLSSGKILHEAMATAYHRETTSIKSSSCLQHHHDSATNTATTRHSPRSVTERRRYVKVQIC